MLLQPQGVKVYQGQPGMSSTDFFNPDKFSWLRPGAVSQWLLQKLVGLTQAQGAWPIIYTAVANEEDLVSEPQPVNAITHSICRLCDLYSARYSIRVAALGAAHHALDHVTLYLTVSLIVEGSITNDQHS